jgi:hypothetical protein
MNYLSASSVCIASIAQLKIKCDVFAEILILMLMRRKARRVSRLSFLPCTDATSQLFPSTANLGENSVASSFLPKRVAL